MSNPRGFALEMLNRVDEDRSYLNLLLPSYQERVPAKDKGFLQELTYGAIRWRHQYDLLIDDLVSHRALEPNLRNVLRLGAHQIFRMRVGQHAAVNETVELAKRSNPKTGGLANAVMRKLATTDLDQALERLTIDMSEVQRLSYIHSVPIWIIRQFAAALKVDLESEVLLRELEALNKTPLVSLSVANPSTRAAMVDAGAQPGIHSPVALNVKGELTEFLATPGVRVQDEGSQLIAQLVAKFSAGGGVLDLCAGPGGKAALIADLAPDSELICIEPVPARAKLVERALGSHRAKVVVADGTSFQPRQKVQVALVDAPCSGLGSLRRKPESRWLKDEGEIPQLRTLQLRLLENAATTLADGGYLVYSTCTPVLAETNSVIVEFLERNQGFKLEDAGAAVRQIAPSLKLPTGRKTIQLWTGLHGTDDMFIALMRKEN